MRDFGYWVYDINTNKINNRKRTREEDMDGKDEDDPASIFYVFHILITNFFY